MLVLFTTAPNTDEAEELAKKIVSKKLAACVQVLPPMKSFYYWEDEVKSDDERLLIIKTLDEKYDELKSLIHAEHSYDVPQIVAVAADKVSSEYLKWMEDYLLKREK